MNADQTGFETIWEMLLSREPERILAAYKSLPADQKSGVLDHLEQMACEPGWQFEQRISAQAALDAIPED